MRACSGVPTCWRSLSMEAGQDLTVCQQPHEEGTGPPVHPVPLSWTAEPVCHRLETPGEAGLQLRPKALLSLLWGTSMRWGECW